MAGRASRPSEPRAVQTHPFWGRSEDRGIPVHGLSSAVSGVSTVKGSCVQRAGRGRARHILL